MLPNQPSLSMYFCTAAASAWEARLLLFFFVVFFSSFSTEKSRMASVLHPPLRTAGATGLERCQGACPLPPAICRCVHSTTSILAHCWACTHSLVLITRSRAPAPPGCTALHWAGWQPAHNRAGDKTPVATHWLMGAASAQPGNLIDCGTRALCSGGGPGGTLGRWPPRGSVAAPSRTFPVLLDSKRARCQQQILLYPL